MFNQITRAANDLVNDTAGKAAEFSMNAGNTAAKVSSSVSQTARTTAAKFQNVQFDMTDLDLSGITRLDPRNLTKIEFPSVNMPAVNLPKVELPKVELPKIDVDVPAEVDRVADLVRDVAYVGLGAAVITAQQVDANVRRLTSRAA